MPSKSGLKPPRIEHPGGAKSSNKQDKLDSKRGTGKKAMR